MEYFTIEKRIENVKIHYGNDKTVNLINTLRLLVQFRILKTVAVPLRIACLKTLR